MLEQPRRKPSWKECLSGERERGEGWSLQPEAQLPGRPFISSQRLGSSVHSDTEERARLIAQPEDVVKPGAADSDLRATFRARGTLSPSLGME